MKKNKENRTFNSNYKILKKIPESDYEIGKEITVKFYNKNKANFSLLINKEWKEFKKVDLQRLLLGEYLEEVEYE